MSKQNVKSAFYLMALFALFSAGCASSGNGSSNGVIPQANSLAPKIVKISGNGQIGTMGVELPDPLVVSVKGASGEPVANVEMRFAIKSGLGTLSADTGLTDSTGMTSVYLTPGGSLIDVEVEASSDGFESAVFTETPLLPPLSDIVGGIVNGVTVTDMKVVFAQTDAGMDVLVVFIGDDAGVTFNLLPAVTDILGGLIRGVPVEDIPTLFVPGNALVDKIRTDVTPSAATVAASFAPTGIPGSVIPTVKYLTINGKASVVGIFGDTTGISGVDQLGTMLDNKETVNVDGWPVLINNLPLYIVEATDFPSDPAADFYSYKSSACCSVVPMYDEVEPIIGAIATSLPFLSVSLALAETEPVEVAGANTTTDVSLLDIPPVADVGVPITALRPLRLDWIPVIEAKEQIKAVSAGHDQVMTGMKDNLIDILGWALANYNSLGGLLGGGGNITAYDILLPMLHILPSMNALSKNMKVVLPDLQQQIILVETKLIPAMASGLASQGGLDFGGYADDMIPSNVTNDVLPMMQNMIYILQDMLPVLDRMFADMDDLIPDNGDSTDLVVNAVNGGLDKLLADLNELIPMLGDLLAVVENPGMSIIEDFKEELVFRYSGTTTTLGDTGVFQDLVGCIAAKLPPDTKLGDIKIFTALVDILGPLLGGTIDLSQLQSASLFGDLVPLLGGMSLGSTIPDLITMVTNMLGPALPGLVDSLQNFQGIQINL